MVLHVARVAAAERDLDGHRVATPRELAPLPAQLDMDGNAHEIAPANERLRLFDPAPAQLDGQTFLSDAELER